MVDSEKTKQILAAEAREVRPRLGSAGLCVRDDTVLLIFSNKYDEWVLPGGGVKFGASIADTIVREIQEEAGITVTYGHVLDVVEIIRPEQENHRVIVYSQVTYVSGTPKAGDDADKAQFFTRPELADLAAKGQLTGVSRDLLVKTGWLAAGQAAAWAPFHPATAARRQQPQCEKGESPLFGPFSPFSWPLSRGLVWAMKHLALLTLAFVVAGCAVTPEQNEVPITATFAVGDPCKTNGMLYDTPPGFPRICLNGKWVPAEDGRVCHMNKAKKYRHK